MSARPFGEDSRVQRFVVPERRSPLSEACSCRVAAVMRPRATALITAVAVITGSGQLLASAAGGREPFSCGERVRDCAED
jgi:hypothetical protein